MKNLVLNLAAFLMVATLFVSCANESSDNVRESAVAAVENTANAAKDAVTPTPTATPAADAEPVGPTTTVEFTETEFDFGTIDSGEKVAHTYTFKNTGTEPLIISNAKGSCGCTVPKWPKEPIPVGGSGEIQVEFNSKNKKGKQSKRVTITANTNPSQSFLTIKGDVTPSAEQLAKEAEKKAADAAAGAAAQ